MVQDILPDNISALCSATLVKSVPGKSLLSGMEDVNIQIQGEIFS